MALAIPFIGAAIGGGLASAGVIAGSYLGISAASLGFMGGQLLGSMFQKGQNVEGPRATDLAAQYSNYGAAIPRHYGVNRFAGNVIFCTDKREVATTSKQGGKGGGKSKVTQYSYNGDIAIGLVDCRQTGPITGIRKIWVNGKLKVDNSATASIAALVGSDIDAAGFKVYTGTTTQLPDPTIEATKGAGNVPGYRGLAYVMLDHANCENGQFAQYAFEVVLAGGSSIIVQSVASGSVSGYGAVSSAFVDDDFQMIYPRTASGEVYGKRTDSWLRINTSGWNIDGVVDKEGIFIGGGGGENFLGNSDEAGTFFQWRSKTFPFPLGDLIFQRPNGSMDVYKAPVATTSSTSIFLWSHMASMFLLYSTSTGVLSVYDKANYFSGWTNWYASPAGYPALGAITVPGSFASCWVTDSAIYVSGTNYSGGSDVFIARYDRATLAFIGVKQWASGTAGLPTSAGVDFAVHVISSGEMVLGGRASSAVWTYDGASTLTLLANLNPQIGNGGIEAIRKRDNILGIANLGTGGGNTDTLHIVNLAALTGPDYAVADIIKAECLLAGLPPDQIDVSTLTDVLAGYTIGRVSSPRSIIEPLLSGFQIDTFESGGVRKFIKRKDQAVAATIPFEELGAVEAGQDLGDPFPLVHSNSLELPRRVTVNYINKDADYQQGSESVSREVVDSSFDMVVDVPYACTSTHANTVAQITIFNAWAERNTRKTTLTRKYAWLDAADHLMIQGKEGGEYTRWIVQKLNDTGYLIELELTPADMSLYAGQGVGTSLAAGQAIDAPVPPARLVVLDSPILRDADDNAGAYVPIASTGPTFAGAVLLLGQDASNLEERASVTAEAYIGYAENALASWADPVMDETNSLTVQMRSDVVLNNSTRDLVLDSSANALAVGVDGRWEILQFIRATNLGGGRFTLTGLHRGQRGTEQYRGTHSIGDTVVVLTAAGMARPSFDVSELGQSRAFKAVAYGRDPDRDGITTAVNTGVGLKCFAPVDLRASRSSNDITATWNRRTRLSESAMLGIVPLGEAAEKYEMVIYTSNTYATERRSIFSASETATYTSAMQTLDGVTPGAAAYARVFQISDKVGRGYPLQGTL